MVSMCRICTSYLRAATEPAFYSILGVFGELYNKACFQGDPYHENDWRGVEVEWLWLVNVLGSFNSKYETLIQNLSTAEENYKYGERNYKQKVCGH